MIYEDDHIQVLGRHGSARYGLLTFSPSTMIADGLTFWGDRVAEHFDLTAVGIVGKRPNWFPRTSILEAAKAIARHFGEMSQIVAYGSSMGAYGALKYGRRLGATEALAFAPQFSISPTDVPFDGRFYAHHRTDLHRDMAVHTSDLPDNAYIFYDPGFAPDARNVALINQGKRKAVTIVCRNTGHETIRSFAGMAKVQALLEICLAHDDKALQEMATQLSRKSQVRGKIIAERAMLRHPAVAERIFEKYCADEDRRAQAINWHRLSNTMHDADRRVKARELSLRALTLCPRIPDFYLRMSRTFDPLDAQALEWAMACTDIGPQFAMGHAQVASLLEQRDDVSGALASLERAVALAPSDPKLLVSMSRLLLKAGDGARARTVAEDASALWEPARAMLAEVFARTERKATDISL